MFNMIMNLILGENGDGNFQYIMIVVLSLALGAVVVSEMGVPLFNVLSSGSNALTELGGSGF